MAKIILTGASGGFGSLTTKELISNGHSVAATMRAVNGRNAEIAAELQGIGAKIIEMDVTNEASVNAGVAAAIDQLGGLDIVINNAGVGVSGMQEHFTPEDLQRLFDINVFGVHRVNRAALPHLRKQGSGSLIHVSSLLGRISLPFYGPYNASKWALEALAENYRVELSRFGVESLLVEPGGYPTTFLTNLMTPSDDSRSADYGDFMNVPQAMGESFGAALQANPEQKPEKVAEAISNLINQPFGQRPFRTVVDNMGMGDGVKGLNQAQEQVTEGIYGAFGMGDMLKVNQRKANG